MNDLINLTFEQQPVRIVSRDGEPWFVAADVAEILGYRDAPNMVRNLDDDEAATHNLSSSGQQRELTIVSESGLYNAIFRSRRPEAAVFRKWVTSEVLPSIRRTGGYGSAARLTTADMLARIEALLAHREMVTVSELADALSISDDQRSRSSIGVMLRLLGWRRAWVRGDRSLTGNVEHAQ